MAFYDFLLGSSHQIQSHIKRLGNRNAKDEDRDASARWLAQNGSEDALYGMFCRFDLQTEHTLKDRNEKELVFDLLFEKGALALPHAKRFALSSANFQYAVRLIERLSGIEAAVACLVELLAKESVDNEFKPDKKHALLIALAERRSPSILATAAPFLGDHNEGVRAAAVEAIGAQEGDEARPFLLKALANRREESTRIRGRLGEIFASRKWAIDTEDPWLPNHLPNGFRLENGLLVAAGRQEGARIVF